MYNQVFTYYPQSAVLSWKLLLHFLPLQEVSAVEYSISEEYSYESLTSIYLYNMIDCRMYHELNVLALSSELPN